MNAQEKFAKLRECIAFGSAQSPYVLTDAEEFDLYDFLTELEEPAMSRILSTQAKIRAIPRTPEALAHWEEIADMYQDWPTWGTARFSESKIRELAEQQFPGYTLEHQTTVIYDWEVME